MMSSKKISSYFSKEGHKLASTTKSCKELQQPPSKRPKYENGAEAKVSKSSEVDNKAKNRVHEKNGSSEMKKNVERDFRRSITPEEKVRMEKNKQMALEKLKAKNSNHDLENLVGASWYKALEPEFRKPYFKQLMAFIEKERTTHTIFPPKEQVFSWTQLSDVSQVKVVILGQDPYHGAKQAHGLCFSVQKGVPPPPSLVNIFKELSSDTVEHFETPNHGDLSGWAKQGVLLLNAVLTVRSASANSHKTSGWETFTDAVVAHVNKQLNNVVFMLWGVQAQKKGSVINTSRHCVLRSVHPSPLSAHRGFLGCRHFSLANAYLRSHGNSPIDWTRLP